MFWLWTGDATRRGELHYNSLPLEYWSILVTIDCEVLSNGPDKKEIINDDEHVGMQKKFKQQILWSLTIFLITKSCLSPSNTEIRETVYFCRLLFPTLMTGRDF